MISLDIKNEISFKQQVQLLQLPADKKKKLLRKLAMKVRTDSRQRLKKAQDLDGKGFAKVKPRSSRKRRKRQTLQSLGTNRHLKVSANSRKSWVGYRSRFAGAIAKQHQQGGRQKWTVEKLKREQRSKDEGDGKKNASRAQARALLDVGFKIRRKSGNGFKTPGLKYITENYSVAQAGVILRSMKNEQAKKSWVIDLPERAFLGVSKAERQAHIEQILNELLAEG